MWFKKACIECGFLGWREAQGEPEGTSWSLAVSEVNKLERDEVRRSFEGVTQPGDPELGMWWALGCFRSQWSHLAVAVPSSQKPLFADVVKARLCHYYVGYDASHKPEQHLQLQEKARDRAERLQNIAFGGLAVAGSTALVELFRWLTSKLR
ncbi:MAG: hypothetical protein HY671_12860 [Chloroflexi bacterium]|nr:hypothetical protein [Chloroflexota bacterium]